MLEITSPGPLPDTMPIEKLGTGRSEIRNRILAPIFKDLKLIEAWGTGIKKMKQELQNYPEIELTFQEAGHAFQVQFRKGEIEQGKAESGQSRGRVRAESGQSQKRREAESIRSKVLRSLEGAPLSKSEIANKIGVQQITGQLNRVVRSLI